jgi:hypothetical protein
VAWWVKVVAGDLVGEIEFWAILFSLIVVPLLWVIFRKQNATDREGREPPIPNKRLTGETDPRSNLPLYGPGLDYTSRAIGKEWEHPDTRQYREKLERDREEAEKSEASGKT